MPWKRLLFITLLTLFGIWPARVTAQTIIRRFSSNEFYDTIPARGPGFDKWMQEVRAHPERHRHMPMKVSTAPAIAAIRTPVGLDDAFQLSITTVPSFCSGYNGIITVNPSGGTPPYKYSWNNIGWFNSNFLITYGATYLVKVMDATGAIVTTSVVLSNISPIPTVQYTGIANPSACGKADGMLSMQGFGGTPGYLPAFSYRRDSGCRLRSK